LSRNSALSGSSASARSSAAIAPGLSPRRNATFARYCWISASFGATRSASSSCRNAVS
jgi:hypothetical protein